MSQVQAANKIQVQILQVQKAQLLTQPPSAQRDYELRRIIDKIYILNITIKQWERMAESSYR